MNLKLLGEQMFLLIVWVVLGTLIVGSFTFYALAVDAQEHQKLAAFCNLKNVYESNCYVGNNGQFKVQNGTYFPTTKTFCVYTAKKTEAQLIRISLHEIGHAIDDRENGFVLDVGLNEAFANDYADSWSVTKK